jgi:hypothetical protein
VAALEQVGDSLGVFAVAFAFAAVDGFHGPGMSEDEGDVVVAAGVSQPVPAVHALAADDQSVAEGLDGFLEGPWCSGEVAGEACLSGLVEDDQEQGPGVEIDAGIESGVGGRLEEAHEDLGVSVPRSQRLSAVCCKFASRAFMSIHPLQQTGHATDGSTCFSVAPAWVG